MGDKRPLMGTEVSVWLWHDDKQAGQQAVAAVFAEVERIDALMSTYKDDSAISAINRDAANAPVAAGSELYRLIVRSLDISQLTRGAFDITYDSVGKHYDFRNRLRPDQTTIESELGSVDYRFVEADDDAETIKFAQDGVRINLGGIAKGYAVDRCADVLRQHGVVMPS